MLYPAAGMRYITPQRRAGPLLSLHHNDPMSDMRVGHPGALGSSMVDKPGCMLSAAWDSSWSGPFEWNVVTNWIACAAAEPQSMLMLLRVNRELKLGAKFHK